MVDNKVKHYVVNENDTIAEAYWKYSEYYHITVVVDDNEKFCGVVGKKEWDMARKRNARDKVKEIVNTHCSVIVEDEVFDEYTQARNIYLEKNIQYIPVVNREGDVKDVFSRQRALYRQYFDEGNLPRMNYGVCIMAAAKQAKALNINRISILEFGVAGGNGLLSAQLHAREIGRLLNIQIDVYGFDLGTGLPETVSDTVDIAHVYQPGFFKMDFERLNDRLESNSKLVLGDIKETLVDFLEKYDAAPIGAMFVDVDYYSSTKPILDWLGEKDDSHFLPRVLMYFDDVSDLYEGIGEHRAILEFNKEYENRLRISPEGLTDQLDWLDIVFGVKSRWMGSRDYLHSRIKICHRYTHDYYDTYYIDLKYAAEMIERI